MTKTTSKRTDTLNLVYVVTDATKDSTFGDICFSADPVRLANIIVGAGGSGTVAREHWTFYTNARSAAVAAYARMEAAGALDVTDIDRDIAHLSPKEW